MQILELGSGVGLLGTVIAKQATQAEIHLTDLDGIVLDHLRETIDKSECDKKNCIELRNDQNSNVLPSKTCPALILSLCLLLTGLTCLTTPQLQIIISPLFGLM